MALFKKGKKAAESTQVLDVSKEEPRTSRAEPHIGERKGPAVAWRVLERPKVTEKATKLLPYRQYVFLVNKKSTKPEIKKAVEETYRVRIDRVNMVSIRGKRKQWRGQTGKAPDIKKAIVTLREGDKIELG
jgi:large subunit ribosomal protein L23